MTKYRVEENRLFMGDRAIEFPYRIYKILETGKGVVVLLDWMDIEREGDLARNIFFVEPDSTIRWQLADPLPAQGPKQPFTGIGFRHGKLLAYNLEGGYYEVDIKTGEAKLIRGQRPW